MKSQIKEKQNKKTSHKKAKTELPLFCQLNENQIIDINAEFSWKENLEDNQKRFVIFYCFQYINEGKFNLTDAARKAGYKDSKSLKTQAQLLIKNPKIYREIKNIQEQITKNLTKLNLKSEINRIIQKKINRSNIKVSDFYDIEVATTDRGQEFVKGNVKPLSELTEEQIKMIQGIKFEGQRGIVNYILPDSAKEENDLINIYKNLFDRKEEDKTEYSTELTIEQIKDKVTAKVKLIKENESAAKEAGVFVDEPEKLLEEV